MTTAPIVVMGVSGSGKSTVGALLAERLHRPFVDADDLHPTANKIKMSQGIPLTDADRWPWLDQCAARLAVPPPCVLACSALRRTYRDRLRAQAPTVLFVHLDTTPTALAARMSARTNHFMPPSLLTSQLSTLEPLAADEPHLTFPTTTTPAALVAEIAAAL
jgi:gluconokinase